MYKLPCALVTKTDDDDPDYPTFAKLLSIYMVNNIPSFHVQELKTKYFHKHFHCFVVESLARTFCIGKHDLVTHLPHHIRYLPGYPGVTCIVPNFYQI